MDDPRMGLGTDQLEWLPDLLSEMTEQPEPLPWMGWGPLPMMPPQRQASEAAPLPSENEVQSMAPWANRMNLPGMDS